jgi:hypothetical protein
MYSLKTINDLIPLVYAKKMIRHAKYMLKKKSGLLSMRDHKVVNIDCSVGAFCFQNIMGFKLKLRDICKKISFYCFKCLKMFHLLSI